MAKRRSDMIRRHTAFGLAACLTLLCGCSSKDDSYNYDLQLFRVMREGFSASFGSQRVTREAVAAISYATIGYSIGDGRENILVLATSSGGDLLWTSASHVVIVTHDGRVKRTLGLAHDVSAVTPSGAEDIPAPVRALSGPFASTRLADFPDVAAYAIPLSCRAASRGPQTIAIIGTPVATVRVDESCTAPSLKWSFVDSYWINPRSGQVWRSVQHVHPKADAVEIEVFRPPDE